MTLAGVRAVHTPLDLEALSFDATASWDGTRLGVDGELRGGLGEPAVLSGKLALSAGNTWRPVLDRRGAVEARVRWEGDVERLFAVLPLPDHLLSGRAAVDLGLDGSLAQPRFGGGARLTGGRYENLVSGTIVDRLSVSTALEDRGTQLILNIEGTDGYEGRVDGAAAVLNAFTGEPRLTSTLSLERFLIARTAGLTAEAPGRVTAKGGFGAVSVEGRIVVGRAEVRLLRTLPPSVAELGALVYVGEPTPSVPGPGAIALGTQLKLDIELPGATFVRGRGLDSEWRGELAIRGTAAVPAISGRVVARRGRLDLLGRIFTLEKGEIGFSGGGSSDPTVAISLAREANGIRGRIAVDGTASRPELSFSSTPSVPEDEVLARVLFGRPTASLSVAEALQLAGSVAVLTSGGAAAVDSLRQTMGVDVLRVDSATQGSAVGAASVGRYLRDDVYVGAKQSFDGKTGSIVVEWEVLDHVRLDADLGYRGTSSVGATWRRDF